MLSPSERCYDTPGGGIFAKSARFECAHGRCDGDDRIQAQFWNIYCSLVQKSIFFFYPSDCQSPLFSPCCFPLFPLVLFLYLTFLFLQFPLILHPYPLSQSLSPSSLSNPACLINFPSHDSSLQHSVCPNLGVGGGNYHFYASSVRFCQI